MALRYLRGAQAALLVACLTAAGVALRADEQEDAAQAAAESWLKLVDTGQYAASWEQAARALKAAITQADWTEMARGVRAPLGSPVSRKLKSREYTEKAPSTRMIGGKLYTWGAGRYVVVQYETAFAGKPPVVETIVPMADADGVWRVSGYSIR